MKHFVNFYKRASWIYIAPLYLMASAQGSTIVNDVSVFGFDMGGSALGSAPVNGQNSYNSSGDLLGTWSVVTGNNFSANQDENNRSETSSISYTVAAKVGNTNGADDHSSTFASFNAGADASDYIVINNESLDISVSWTFRDMRWQRRDMTDTAESYDVSWTISSFDNLAADLGTQTGSEALTSLGVNESFGFTGFVNTANVGTTVVATTFTGDTPEALLEYSGTATGQLTGKYDGSNFNLTLSTTQLRDTDATALWDETMDGDGDLNLGENPRAQLRAYLDGDHSYSLDYTTYTLIPVPEPATTSFLSVFVLLSLCRRKRS